MTGDVVIIMAVYVINFITKCWLKICTKKSFIVEFAMDFVVTCWVGQRHHKVERKKSEMLLCCHGDRHKRQRHTPTITIKFLIDKSECLNILLHAGMLISPCDGKSLSIFIVISLKTLISLSCHERARESWIFQSLHSNIYHFCYLLDFI